MLPTESFAEVVGFLPLIDLSAVVVTNALCYSLALEASSGIRWEEFPGLRFFITSHRVEIYTDLQDLKHVTSFKFPNEASTAEFVAAAFPNCVFEYLVIAPSDWSLVDAIRRVADSVIIKGALLLSGSVAGSREWHLVVLGLLRNFRNTKALELRFNIKASDDQVNEFANFFRGSGIQELWLRFYIDSTLKKVALV